MGSVADEPLFEASKFIRSGYDPPTMSPYADAKKA